MEGDSLFASLALFIISLRVKNYTSATISIIFGGLVLGFLVYNFYPARIRSGSSGKTAYGFILAVLSVMSGAKIATGIIVLMIPLIDFVWVIIGRVKKHRPRSISSLMQISDKSHLHHRLLKLGLNEPQIAFFEYLLSAILGTIALAVSGAMNAFIWLSTTLGIIIILLVISRLLHKRTQAPPPDSEKSPESKYSY
jgi:UDP-N-acetylmuramyl pentapeptide phosphotransferase/UDP-N-acetylglucosamine-1-phosphate transferase